MNYDKSEITFLEKFLTLSQERNVGKFKFNIQTCSAFDPKKDLIPPMLIQPFVENSLIHGFSDLETEGYLEILFKKEGKTTIVEISDNGVGKENSSIRKGPAPQGHKTSLGMSLIENRIKLLNEIHEYDFRLKTGELDPNQKNKGTHVEIKYNNIN